MGVIYATDINTNALTHYKSIRSRNEDRCFVQCFKMDKDPKNKSVYLIQYLTYSQGTNKSIVTVLYTVLIFPLIDHISSLTKND